MRVIKNKNNAKIAFLSTIISGLIIHMYALTHNFLTYDSMWNLYSNQDMLSSGRPFLQYACMFSSYYDLTWVNGILAIIYLGISSIILMELLEIKRKITVIVVSICLVGFPSITSLFCYSYTVDGYSLAILLSILSVWLTVKIKRGIIFGALSLGISMGIYQAYLSIAISLCLCILVFELLEEKDFIKIEKLSLKMVIMGAFSYIIYLGSLKGMLLLKNVELSGYQGTNKVLSLQFNNIFLGIKNAYLNFAAFAIRGGVLTPNVISKVLIITLVIIGALEFVFTCNLVRKRFNVYRMVVIFLILLFFPISISTIAILSPDTYFHTLLRYPWVILFIFSIVLAEKIDLLLKSKRGHELYRLTFLCILILFFNYFIISNIVYFNMNERYEKTYATSLRIVSRLENMEGYQANTKIAILGGVLSSEYFEAHEETYEITKNYFGSYGTLCVTDTDKFAAFFSHYLGVSIETVGLERELELVDTEDFQKMSIFPEKESIRWMEDIIVVKLNG